MVCRTCFSLESPSSGGVTLTAPIAKPGATKSTITKVNNGAGVYAFIPNGMGATWADLTVSDKRPQRATESGSGPGMLRTCNPTLLRHAL
jgi:hypothetical protein